MTAHRIPKRKLVRVGGERNFALPGFDIGPVRDGEEATAASDEFNTPAWILAWIPVADLDPCSNVYSLVAARRTFDIRRGEDGLVLPWGEPGDFVFCNPPYSDCARWVAKAAEEARRGVTVLLLIPAKPGEVYWHSHIWSFPDVEVGILRGRVVFPTPAGIPTSPGTFGSALVALGPRAAEIAAHVRRKARGHAQRPRWLRVVEE